MGYLLHHLVAEAAAAHPDVEALRYRGQVLTYRQLDAATKALARTLVDRGVRRGDRVAIRLRKGFEQWISVFGALRAGAVFVPIDPSLPPGRASGMMADCSVAALVTTEGLPSVDGPDLTIVVGEGSGLPGGAMRFSDAVADPAAEDPAIPMVDLDLAWITYTSGSTGTPKGVALSHRALMLFAELLAEVTGARPGERVSGFTPLHFSLCIWDLFPSMRAAATVVLVPEERAVRADLLEGLIRDERIAVWCSVPSALRMLVAGGLRERPFPDLRQLWFAGEVFPTRDLFELRRRLPDVELLHMFGGSETMGRMVHRVDDVPLDRPTAPLGRPFPNTEAIVLTDDGRQAEVGEVGELFMRSGMLMRGYWGDPAKTAEVLVPNPLVPEPKDRVCATGDLVRVLPGGLYEFVGRTDDQIKLRGVRIELGDIDTALLSHPHVADAAAVAVDAPGTAAGKEIVACVVAAPGSGLDEAALARHLRGRLPSYMAPARIVFVEQVPTNASGKVDRPGLRDTVAGLEETR